MLCANRTGHRSPGKPQCRAAEWGSVCLRVSSRSPPCPLANTVAPYVPLPVVYISTLTSTAVDDQVIVSAIDTSTAERGEHPLALKTCEECLSSHRPLRRTFQNVRSDFGQISIPREASAKPTTKPVADFCVILDSAAPFRILQTDS